MTQEVFNALKITFTGIMEDGRNASLGRKLADVYQLAALKTLIDFQTNLGNLTSKETQQLEKYIERYLKENSWDSPSSGPTG